MRCAVLNCAERRGLCCVNVHAWLRFHAWMLLQTNVAVAQAFEELVAKILDTPSLVGSAGGAGGVKLGAAASNAGAASCSC